MPAERAGSSPGVQGKAIPVEQTAGQLRLPIVTAENPKGAARRASVDLSTVSDAWVPEAIGNVESVTPVTMEEVVSRLTAALVKVVSNQGAPGPDGQTVEELLFAVADRWPGVGRQAAGWELSSRRDPPGEHPEGGRRCARVGDPERDR